MRGPCQSTTCTFNATKKCVLGNAPDECENRPLIDEGTEEDALQDDKGEPLDVSPPLSAGVLGGPVLEASNDELETLPASRTMGLPQLNTMMESRPTCLVGIVGLSGAGKTAVLVSAYLLLSKGMLEGFSYADSATLRAFEEISRATRSWRKGDPPEHITNHTTLTDSREAGFLHLRLRRDTDDRIFDILLPDLPGEWSRALIGRKDAARLEFLRSANVIWLMVDGRQFANTGRVAYARYRARLLIERLADLLGSHRPQLLIVPTWQDKAAFPEDEVIGLQQHGRNFGFEVDVAPIASFSWNDDMNPGQGIASLFSRSLAARPAPPDFWPETRPDSDDRKIAAFRRRP
ncbi:TRAFAC clade GTPase domain-containing protein [Novacetimonas sp. GS1]|uniref:TRAFAC clade GTPase domain-containing protein n=1 Tax=Novacetimonas sp. GS1 TaxID=3119990 RepID=UPI002FCD320C